MSAVRIDIVTIFPGFFGPLQLSLLGKATQRGIIDVRVHDLREWANDPHRTVDDAPFGGGPGMVMTPGPWGEALDSILARAGADTSSVTPPGGGTRLIVPSPSGVPFRQQSAAGYARCDHLVFACGRYEGIDTRVIEEVGTRVAVDEVSVGDYVLSGGEPAALIMIDAIARLLPGVVGNASSVADDSFGGGTGPMAGLLEGPAYTRPREWRGRVVPEVLLSGDHAAIARWRRDQSLRRTAAHRPDLLGSLPAGALNARDRQVLADAGFPVMAEDVAH